jgi:parallel beta-helix repeat protein
MAKGNVTIAFSLVLLCLLASSAVYLQPVKAQSLTNITINADGSITPTSAPIVPSGNTYNLTSNIDGSITVNRSNIVLDGNGFSLSNGLLLYADSNITVNGFVITGNQFGSNVVYPEDGGAEDGILLSNTSNVMIVNNTIFSIWSLWELNGEAFNGIDVEGGNSNIITGNLILNDATGIFFDNTQKNLITNNDIVDNASQDGLTSCGIWFWHASNNTIYHNNLMDIPYGTQASNGDLGGIPYTPNSVNVWDGGFPAGGNYWGVQTGKEIGNTGISDSPYVLDSQNIDRYPLIRPFNSSFLANYEQEIIPPKVSVVSPLNETYSETNISLSFAINKPFNWEGYSLDGESNVTINGNSTIPNISYGSHSITIYANNTFGIMGASETIDFTVAKSEPFTCMIVSMVSIIVIAVVTGLAIALLYHRRHRKTAKLNQ